MLKSLGRTYTYRYRIPEDKTTECNGLTKQFKSVDSPHALNLKIWYRRAWTHSLIAKSEPLNENLRENCREIKCQTSSLSRITQFLDKISYHCISLAL